MARRAQFMRQKGWAISNFPLISPSLRSFQKGPDGLKNHPEMKDFPQFRRIPPLIKDDVNPRPKRKKGLSKRAIVGRLHPREGPLSLPFR
jgi:hypothetical protein